MADLARLAAQSSPIALVIALLIGGKYLFEALAAARKAKNEGAPSPLHDAATLNEMLRTALEAERKDNAEKQRRLNAANERNDELQEENEGLRERAEMYQRELGELRSQLDEYARRIDYLQAQIALDAQGK